MNPNKKKRKTLGETLTELSVKTPKLLDPEDDYLVSDDSSISSESEGEDDRAHYVAVG